MSNLKKLSLSNIAGGVAEELFERELAEVAKNIDDINTSADASRSITMTITFKPDLDRREIKTIIESKSKLAPVRAASVTTFCGKVDGHSVMLGRDPDQLDMFSEEVAQIQEPKGGVA